MIKRTRPKHYCILIFIIFCFYVIFLKKDIYNSGFQLSTMVSAMTANNPNNLYYKGMKDTNIIMIKFYKIILNSIDELILAKIIGLLTLLAVSFSVFFISKKITGNCFSGLFASVIIFTGLFMNTVGTGFHHYTTQTSINMIAFSLYLLSLTLFFYNKYFITIFITGLAFNFSPYIGVGLFLSYFFYYIFYMKRIKSIFLFGLFFLIGGFSFTISVIKVFFIPRTSSVSNFLINYDVDIVYKFIRLCFAGMIYTLRIDFLPFIFSILSLIIIFFLIKDIYEKKKICYIITFSLFIFVSEVFNLTFLKNINLFVIGPVFQRNLIFLNVIYIILLIEFIFRLLSSEKKTNFIISYLLIFFILMRSFNKIDSLKLSYFLYEWLSLYFIYVGITLSLKQKTKKYIIYSLIYLLFLVIILACYHFRIKYSYQPEINLLNIQKIILSSIKYHFLVYTTLIKKNYLLLLLLLIVGFIHYQKNDKKIFSTGIKYILLFTIFFYQINIVLESKKQTSTYFYEYDMVKWIDGHTSESSYFLISPKFPFWGKAHRTAYLYIEDFAGPTVKKSLLPEYIKRFEILSGLNLEQLSWTKINEMNPLFPARYMAKTFEKIFTEENWKNRTQKDFYKLFKKTQANYLITYTSVKDKYPDFKKLYKNKKYILYKIPDKINY